MIQGADPNGKWHTFNLDEHTQILGIHGSLNSAPNIRALGFLVWTVAEADKTPKPGAASVEEEYDD